jgi:microcystin-dependent protein
VNGDDPFAPVAPGDDSISASQYNALLDDARRRRTEQVWSNGPHNVEVTALGAFARIDYAQGFFAKITAVPTTSVQGYSFQEVTFADIPGNPGTFVETKEAGRVGVQATDAADYTTGTNQLYELNNNTAVPNNRLVWAFPMWLPGASPGLLYGFFSDATATGGTLTVKEKDGDPSVTGVNTLVADQDTGLAVEAGAAGEAVLKNTVLRVRKNSAGAVAGPWPRLNLIEGAGIAIGVQDDGIDKETDVTIQVDLSGTPAADIPATLTVRELDGTPSLSGRRLLSFDQADGFVVTDGAGGAAEAIVNINEDTLGTNIAGNTTFITAISGNATFITAIQTALVGGAYPYIFARRNSAGVTAGPRRRLNFIEGAGIAIGVVDDPRDNEIDVTISSLFAWDTGEDSGTAITQNFPGATGLYFRDDLFNVSQPGRLAGGTLADLRPGDAYSVLWTDSNGTAGRPAWEQEPQVHGISLGVAGEVTGELTLLDGAGANSLTMLTLAPTADQTWYMPPDPPSADDVLTVNTWTAPSAYLTWSKPKLKVWKNDSDAGLNPRWGINLQDGQDGSQTAADNALRITATDNVGDDRCDVQFDVIAASATQSGVVNLADQHFGAGRKYVESLAVKYDGDHSAGKSWIQAHYLVHGTLNDASTGRKQYALVSLSEGAAGEADPTYTVSITGDTTDGGTANANLMSLDKDRLKIDEGKKYAVGTADGVTITEAGVTYTGGIRTGGTLSVPLANIVAGTPGQILQVVGGVATWVSSLAVSSLAGGTAGQVLQTVSGVPTWVTLSLGTSNLADNSVTDAKLRDSVGTSVIGRSANSTGDPADIVASADGQYLRRSGGTLAFGSLSASDLTFGAQSANRIFAGPVSGEAAEPTFRTMAFADMPQMSGNSVLVRSGTIDGKPEALLATTNGHVLQRKSNALVFDTIPAPEAGSVGTSNLADNSVTDAKLRDSVGTSVIGRSANSTGDPADIAASNDGDVLRRSGTALRFGLLTDSNFATANKDGVAATPSLRTLGTGAQQACAGNDSRLSDTRTPTDATVTLAKLAAAVAAALVPTGSILPYGGSSAPAGYLLCNGTAVSRTTYATLFTAIGTTFGAGDGTTTFNVPNFGARFPLGPFGGAYSVGAAGGAQTHVLTTAEMPAHTHAELVTASPTGGSQQFYTIAGSTGSGGAGGLLPNTGSTGGGIAHNNMPPYLTVNFIIKT